MVEHAKTSQIPSCLLVACRSTIYEDATQGIEAALPGVQILNSDRQSDSAVDKVALRYDLS